MYDHLCIFCVIGDFCWLAGAVAVVGWGPWAFCRVGTLSEHLS